MAILTEIPAAALPSLNNDRIARYSRHLILPEDGGAAETQTTSTVCGRTGGLGSPLAFYLAAAGVGTLGLVDFDVVSSAICSARSFTAPRTWAG